MNTDDIARALRTDANVISGSDLTRPTLPRRRGFAPSKAGVLAAAAVIAVGVVVGTVFLTGGGRDEAGPIFHQDAQPQSAEADCATPIPESLEKLDQTADAVIVGKVTAISDDKPGTAAEPTGEATGSASPSRFLSRTLTVSITDQLSGATTVGNTVDLETFGWVRRDTSSNDWYPIVVNSWPRLGVSDTAVFPLLRQPSGEYHILCSGPLVVEDGRIVDTGSDEAINREAYGLRVGQLKARIG